MLDRSAIPIEPPIFEFEILDPRLPTALLFRILVQFKGLAKAVFGQAALCSFHILRECPALDFLEPLRSAWRLLVLPHSADGLLESPCIYRLDISSRFVVAQLSLPKSREDFFCPSMIALPLSKLFPSCQWAGEDVYSVRILKTSTQGLSTWANSAGL